MKIISLLHCYSMKLYSSRMVQKIKEALSDDIGNANRSEERRVGKECAA